jgi:ssDNA-binding replication factor A large subunit
MEFFIRQGASDPILKMRMIDDGKNDKSSFNDLLENSNITFNMFRIEDGEPFILNSQCNITTRNKKYNQTTDEYYIVHRFTESHTSKIGKYEGKITIQFLDTNSNPTNKLILPIKEKLFITVF